MSAGHSAPIRSNRAIAVVIALIASLLVLVSPNLDSKADYIDSNTGPIVYNDRVCNLGDPNDHTTSATAFEISTSEQLWEITDCVSSSATIYFELGDDIDVSDASKAGTAPTASPIGHSTLTVAYSFSGVLDGKNRSISGLNMSADDYGVGLFNYLHDATISNLVIAGSFVTTATATGYTNSAGALAMVAAGTLNLVSISNQAGVTGKNYVGGLVGYVFDDANISDSFNNGSVFGAGESVGGLVGSVNDNAIIDSSFNYAAISGSNQVGGLVGYVGDLANINYSHNAGPVSGSDEVGGLVGYVGNANINSSSNTGTVSATANYVGGLVGYVFNDANISSSYNTGAVSGSDGVGGLVGYVGNANINSSYNTGPVSGADVVGGLVGYVGNVANITSSYNAGTVSGQQYVGGLVGYVFNDANITSSYNAGPVSGSDRVGGLVGRVDEDANIDSSYNTGSVSGTQNYVGGMVGRVMRDANINSSYNTGAVSGTRPFDGLVGWVQHTVNTISAYSSVASRYVATTPVAYMKLASTFVGFDFESANPIWGFGTCSENDGFPMLRIFAGVATFYPTACYTAPQSETPGSSTPAPVYSGPMIDQAQTVQQGFEVTFNGRRLETVTAAYVGGVEVSIGSAEGQSLVLVIASSIPSGTHDLMLRSTMGTLTFQNGITVLEAQAEVTAEANPETESLQKLTVGSFKGFIAIYTKGYEGQRLSAKVAGKWLVIGSLDETWNGNNYSRTVRFTGAGESIKVHLYIDREFVRTIELSTK